MQHILIPTDFSKNAWNATIYALIFFEGQKINFHFLHVDTSTQINEDQHLHYAGLAIKNKISKDSILTMNDWIQK